MVRTDVAGETPVGWFATTLGEILPLEYGKALPARERNAGEVRVYGSAGAVGSHNIELVQAPALIVGRKGSAGSVYYSVAPSWPIDTVYYTKGTMAVDLEFGYYLLKFLNLNKLDQSTAVPSLGRDEYSKVEVQLPPIAEQRRIVYRIEELFGEIEAGEQELEKAREGLSNFRRTALKAVVTGNLTSDWRKRVPMIESGADFLERIRIAEGLVAASSKGKPAFEQHLPDLPGTWTWTTVGEIGEVSGGLTKNANREALPLSVPYLRVANVQQAQLDLSDVRTIGVGQSELQRTLLRKDDLLFVEGNGSPDQIGRVAMWDGSGVHPIGETPE